MDQARREELQRLMEQDREEIYEWIKAQPYEEISPRQRDVLIDRYVMGNKPSVNIHTKHPTSDHLPPQYCTWEGMGMILMKLKGETWMKDNFGYLLQQSTHPECFGDDCDHRAIGELMFKLTPEAVIYASLKSVGIYVGR
ncbi:hypothetical protein JOD82_002201 [Paenibacillus sp. 1182]|uniref:hypothetical protein n=1 Tax=Paenibacillus sp. 1182 TaxID=2806565 RepID=UPI001AE621A7|nr:hypothetical protein [Paenibacillus sp. 1182]MBP1309181.1 hypothetical protein [Paenibacillus sp. 1182]